MSDSSLEVHMFDNALAYFESLKEVERLKVYALIAAMAEGDYSTLYTKQLAGPVRELIVKQHRIIYFSKKSTLYFITAFKKQSAKTPRREIEHARAVFKEIP